MAVARVLKQCENKGKIRQGTRTSLHMYEENNTRNEQGDKNKWVKGHTGIKIK